MNLCCGGELSADGKRQAKVSKDIAVQLRDDAKKRQNEVRLLLLGAGESGKSTIAKQMKIIHMGGFNNEEKESYVATVHTNIWESMQALIKAAEVLQMPISIEGKERFLEPFSGVLKPEDVDLLGKLWASEEVQSVYEKRSQFQLNDSCKFYLDDLKRVTAEGYVPNEQDVLRSRITTTGIIETSFSIDGKKFTLVDVGGQRSERKKWMHCFEEVTGVLFCVGVSAYDQTLYEDNKTLRIHEALKLFHEICQSKWFTHTAIILFLNKEDLFREKIKAGKSIKVAFPDYEGPTEFDPSIKFIEDKFIDIVDPTTNKPKEIYTHVTCATDTSSVRVVFVAVKDFILNQALGASGLI